MRRAIDLYKYFASKYYSTISGTLVYFLLMGIAPFLFWLTIIAGNIDIEQFVSHDLFAAISPIVSYLKQSAESAVGGSGVILLITSLYSSTNFFYHLRRSGEIIYDSADHKGGIRLRLSSLAVIFLILAFVIVIAGMGVFGTEMLNLIMPELLAEIISDVFLSLTAFGLAYLLNMFACPYQVTYDDIISGTLLTTVLWLVLAAGFTIYLQFADPTKLYGRIASLIIFLLWCYVMINCLMIGIIYNRLFINNKKLKKMF